MNYLFVFLFGGIGVLLGLLITTGLIPTWLLHAIIIWFAGFGWSIGRTFVVKKE